MRPVLTPAEMGAVDAAAPEPVAVLVERAGAAVAREALSMLGGAYGRRVTVVVGKGNNGADGRVAAARLARRGVRVQVLDAASGAVPGACDLLIDAAYGTGFRGEYHPPPAPAGVPVLAVDIPSGVSGLTGRVSGSAWTADRTVTFAAIKPGLLLGEGPALAGEIVVADIGLDVSGATIHLVDAGDVDSWVPRRPVDAHKWDAAVWIVAGSAGMTGAAHLAARAAQRSGAGYVRLSSPGIADDPGRPVESVGYELPAVGWSSAVFEGAQRFRALVVGPGLGRSEATLDSVRALVAERPTSLLLDGDGLRALGAVVDSGSVTWSAGGGPPMVLTPHDGEFEALGGDVGEPDRIAATRKLAVACGATVLRKGPTTVVADPDGSVLLTCVADARLATAGTGDVLSGVIGALLAAGVPPARAAAAGSHLHGQAGRLGPSEGLVACDLLAALPKALAAVRRPAASDLPRTR